MTYSDEQKKLNELIRFARFLNKYNETSQKINDLPWWSKYLASDLLRFSYWLNTQSELDEIELECLNKTHDLVFSSYTLEDLSNYIEYAENLHKSSLANQKLLHFVLCFAFIACSIALLSTLSLLLLPLLSTVPIAILLVLASLTIIISILAVGISVITGMILQHKVGVKPEISTQMHEYAKIRLIFFNNEQEEDQLMPSLKEFYKSLSPDKISQDWNGILDTTNSSGSSCRNS